MSIVDKISTLQYMGNKSRLLESICTPIIENEDIYQVVDLFAGTGSVGFALSKYKTIVSNDFEYYSFIINEAILNGCMLNDNELQALYMKIEKNYLLCSAYLEEELSAEEGYFSSSLDCFESYAFFSNNTPSVFNNETSLPVFCNMKKLINMVKPGASTQDVPFPCLFITYFSNAYFGIRQCCQIDAILAAIAEINDIHKKYVLLTALMTVASNTASSTTHFAQYLTVKSKNTFKNIREKRIKNIISLFKDTLSYFTDKGLLSQQGSKHICFNLDYEECLKSIKIDEHTLVYADPPYFKEHYSRYYHVLNTMCLYDYPERAINPQNKEYAVGRYRVNRNISDFGKRAKAISAFQRLIDACANKKASLMISYSENSLVKIHELLELAKTRYSVRVSKISLLHSSQGRLTDSKRTVKEYLFYCSLPDNMDIEIEKGANDIKLIKPIVDNPGGFIHNYMARKPYNVVHAIIERFSRPGAIIYDPMFGSGTTLIEASKLGRRVIGTDINPLANEICTISLKRWNLEKIIGLINNFVDEVSLSCSDIYEISFDGENRILERCHFDLTEKGYKPVSYWYKVKENDKLSGRRKSEASVEFCKKYELYNNIKLTRLKNHSLIPNSRIAIKEKATVFDYFCKRNLVALDRIFIVLDKYKDNYGYEILRLLVSSAINLIKLSDKKASSQMPYWLPKKNATSRNAVMIIHQKAAAMVEGIKYLQDNCHSFIDDGNVHIYCDPAQNISEDKLRDNSIDLVLTDPPYTDQVPYLEYNQLWFHLLNMEDQVNLKDELIVSDAPLRNKTNADFEKVFNEIITRTSKALKANGLFVMFYHTFDLKSWTNILSMMQLNGLRYVYQIPTPTPRKSFKTVMSPRSTLDGNYLLFFVKDKRFTKKTFDGSLSDAIEMAIASADRIIRSQELVTTQDLYDKGMLKDAFEEGYLHILSEEFKTFADVLKNHFRYENGYWEVME